MLPRTPYWAVSESPTIRPKRRIHTSCHGDGNVGHPQIGNARFTATDIADQPPGGQPPRGNGNRRRATTDKFGYYSFDEVTVGETYFIAVHDRRYRFAQPTQILSVNEALSEVNFAALP